MVCMLERADVLHVLRPSTNEPSEATAAALPAHTLPSLVLRKLFSICQGALQSKTYLLQLWVPGNGHDELVCEETPYVIGTTGSPLIQTFRSHSSKISLQARSSTMVGRVYTSGFPEVCPDIRLYGTTEYQRLPLAKHCSIKASLGVPLFLPASKQCLGVVEVVKQEAADSLTFIEELTLLTEAFAAAGLSSGLSRFFFEELPKMRSSMSDNINTLVTSLQQAGGLLICQSWIVQEAHRTEDSDTILNCRDMPYITSQSHLSSFHNFCKTRALKENLGVVGQLVAAETGSVAFCEDVRKLSMADYPFSACARLFNLQSSCAFGLNICSSRTVDVDQSSTGRVNLVIECFLPHCSQNTPSKDLIQIRVEQVRLLTKVLKQTAESLGLQFMTPSVEDEGSMVRRSIELYMHQMPRLIVGPGHHETMALETNRIALPGTKLQGSGTVGGYTSSMVGSVDFMEQELHSGEPLVTRKPGTGGERLVTYEVLQRHFVYDLRTAAKKIGVCSTTLKRICRQYNIARWPCRAIRKQRQWEQNAANPNPYLRLPDNILITPNAGPGGFHPHAAAAARASEATAAIIGAPCSTTATDIHMQQPTSTLSTIPVSALQHSVYLSPSVLPQAQHAPPLSIPAEVSDMSRLHTAALDGSLLGKASETAAVTASSSCQPSDTSEMLFDQSSTTAREQQNSVGNSELFNSSTTEEPSERVAALCPLPSSSMAPQSSSSCLLVSQAPQQQQQLVLSAFLTPNSSDTKGVPAGGSTSRTAAVARPLKDELENLLANIGNALETSTSSNVAAEKKFRAKCAEATAQSRDKERESEQHPRSGRQDSSAKSATPTSLATSRMQSEENASDILGRVEMLSAMETDTSGMKDAIQRNDLAVRTAQELLAFGGEKTNALAGDGLLDIVVKARYGKDTFRLKFSLQGQKADYQPLLNKLAARLQLPADEIKLEYTDDQDDMIILGCDEDLLSCLQLARATNKSCTLLIKLVVSRIIR